MSQMRRLALLGTVLCCSTLVLAGLSDGNTSRRGSSETGVEAQQVRGSAEMKAEAKSEWMPEKEGDFGTIGVAGGTELSVPHFSDRLGGTVQFLTSSGGNQPSPGGNRQCNHRLVLEDSFGDGWTNDAGTAVNFVELLVNGNSVGSFTMQASDGAGPLYIDFSADTGDTITTIFTANSAGYPGECRYYLLDTYDAVLCAQGFGAGVVPGDCSVTGNCTTPCPAPAGNSCGTPVAVNGPYPQVVAGDNTCAAIQCPGFLNWKATWLAISLPYASNNVQLNFCQAGTPTNWNSVGIAYYTSCADCTAFTAFAAAFNTCGGSTAPVLTAANVAGPTTIYVPIWGRMNDGFLGAYEVEVNVADTSSTYCASNATSSADSLIEQVTVGSFVNYSGVGPV